MAADKWHHLEGTYPQPGLVRLYLFDNFTKPIEVAGITEDQTNGKLVYDPSHPDANEQGYVTMPNVDTVTEMVDLIDAQRAYEANVTALQASKQMFAKTLEILR